MRLAHIAPTACLKTETFANLQFHMCIASQALKDKEYAMYYRNALGYVILDVPTWEEKDGLYDYKKLAQAIELVKPEEVVLPDIWGGSAEESIEAAIEGALVLPALNFMAVPRGHTWDECIYCATEMSKIQGVTAFGILDTTYEKFNVHRLQVALEFSERFPHLALHLLGVQNTLADIQDTTLRKHVRSADTSKLVHWGLNCKHPMYHNVPEHTKREEGYFEREVSEIQLSYVAKNIRYWNALVNGGY